MKRCAPPASCPQLKVSPLAITWLPSTMGVDIRPPCVVHMPISSASERSHRSLPSFDSDIIRPPPLIANTLPVWTSTAGDDQARRCAGTSLANMLYLYSHRSLPVSALKHISRSCSIAPDSDVF